MLIFSIVKVVYCVFGYVIVMLNVDFFDCVCYVFNCYL